VPGEIGLQLSFVLIDAREKGGPAGAHHGIVDQELRSQVVGTFEDHVVVGDERIDILRRCIGDDGFATHVVIQAAQPIGGGDGLGSANFGDTVKGLAMEVARFDDVAIQDADPADAGGGKVLQRRDAEAAGTDNQHCRGADTVLSCLSDLRQRRLP
jgi:hypothetical protein